MTLISICKDNILKTQGTYMNAEHSQVALSSHYRHQAQCHCCLSSYIEPSSIYQSSYEEVHPQWNHSWVIPNENRLLENPMLNHRTAPHLNSWGHHCLTLWNSSRCGLSSYRELNGMWGWIGGLGHRRCDRRQASGECHYNRCALVGT